MKGNKIVMCDNTIFDDVLRTMQERHPRLLLPLVNEVFNENYEDGEKVVRLPEEYQKIISKLISDSCCVIHKNIYHFECQSGTDCSIALRMVEYDFMIARGNAKKVNDVFRIKFPKSCVIYLRSGKAEKERLWLNIELMDGQVIKYEVPVIRICDYTLDEIFKKKLYICLPFYILRYEKSFDQIANDIERMNNLTQEFTMIINKLQEELGNMEDGIYQDILRLMQRIVNYELRDDYKLKERMSDIMGGKILPLPSDELRKAEARGDKAGYKRGMERVNKLFQKLNSVGRVEDFAKSISDSKYQDELFKEFGI